MMRGAAYNASIDAVLQDFQISIANGYPVSRRVLRKPACGCPESWVIEEEAQARQGDRTGHGAKIYITFTARSVFKCNAYLLLAVSGCWLD